MAAGDSSVTGAEVRLQHPIDRARDHVRGGGVADPIEVVGYGDLLCPYCQRLRRVMVRLREALGDRLVYVFRHFPNERAHPGATRIALLTEAAGAQGRFWEMHDWIYDSDQPVTEARVVEHARALGLDMARFAADLESPEIRARVEGDLADGRRNGVTGTPTLFVDGLRYDGAWDFYSLLEGLERPVAARVARSARVFASLPASGGIVLLALGAAGAPLREHPAARGLRSGHARVVSPGSFARALAHRRRVVRRGAADVVLPPRRSGDPARGHGRGAGRAPGRGPARACRRGRRPGAGGHLPGA